MLNGLEHVGANASLKDRNKASEVLREMYLFLVFISLESGNRVV